MLQQHQTSVVTLPFSSKDCVITSLSPFWCNTCLNAITSSPATQVFDMFVLILSAHDWSSRVVYNYQDPAAASSLQSFSIQWMLSTVFSLSSTTDSTFYSLISIYVLTEINAIAHIIFLLFLFFMLQFNTPCFFIFSLAISYCKYIYIFLLDE